MGMTPFRFGPAQHLALCLEQKRYKSKEKARRVKTEQFICKGFVKAANGGEAIGTGPGPAEKALMDGRTALTRLRLRISYLY